MFAQTVIRALSRLGLDQQAKTRILAPPTPMILQKAHDTAVVERMSRAC